MNIVFRFLFFLGGLMILLVGMLAGFEIMEWALTLRENIRESGSFVVWMFGFLLVAFSGTLGVFICIVSFMPWNSNGRQT